MKISVTLQLSKILKGGSKSPHRCLSSAIAFCGLTVQGRSVVCIEVKYACGSTFRLVPLSTPQATQTPHREVQLRFGRLIYIQPHQIGGIKIVTSNYGQTVRDSAKLCVDSYWEVINGLSIGAGLKICPAQRPYFSDYYDFLSFHSTPEHHNELLNLIS